VVQGDEFAAQIESGVLHGVLEHFRKLGLLDGRQSVHNRAIVRTAGIKYGGAL
jgi:hypothetical protein